MSDIFDRLVEALSTEAGELNIIIERAKGIEEFISNLEKGVAKEKEKLSEQMNDNK